MQCNKLCNKGRQSVRKQGEAKPHKRQGIWYLIRRVPKEFEQLDRRGIVRISTEIAVANDPRAVHATKVVKQLSAQLEAYWRGLRDGQSAEARLRFEAAQKRAKALGLQYRTADEINEGSFDDFMKRLNMLIDSKSIDDEREVAAVLGGEERPTIMLSGLVDEVKEVQKAMLAQKSPNQLRKWENPKKLAVKTLTDLVGDKALPELTRLDALKYRNLWLNRIVDEDLEIGTANKNIGHIAKMLKDVGKAHQMQLPPVFADLRIEGETEKQRAAFVPRFVQDSILAPHALDDLNAEARDLVLLVADTGLRLSEAANLLPETIFLEAEVPHVVVKPIGRQLKTGHSAREIPLVGNALAAMKRNPGGFPRYLDKADSLSALVNKYLDGRNLLPTPDHSFYSLRHTFEDRLTAVEAPEKVVASLMGHKWIRPKYGAGPTLEQKARWMERIAFKPYVHGAPPKPSKP